MRMLCLAAIILFVSGITDARIIHVPEEYLTIQGGINAASPGDTVQVAPGTYYENITFAEGINLFGSGWDSTTIDGGGVADVISAPYVNNARIEGFTVQNSNQGGGSPGNIGIFFNPHSSIGTKIVRYCRVRSNGIGIDIWNDFGGTALIDHNVICQNNYNGFQPYLGTVYLTNNTIAYNQGDGYHDWSGGGAVYIQNNIFASNGRYGIFKHRDTPVFISYNDVWNNTGGAYYEGYSGPYTPFVPNPGTGEISADPLFADPPQDFQITWAHFPNPDSTKSHCIDAGDPTSPQDPDGTIADQGALFFDQSIPDVTVTLNPYGFPIVVPVEGGSFDFNFLVNYYETVSSPFQGWIMLRFPDSTWHGPVMGPFQLPAQESGTFFDFDTTYHVPAGQPLGTYVFEARIGAYPNLVWSFDSFTFDVIEDTTSIDPAQFSNVPSEFTLFPNFPNPFNATTTISYSLPHAAFAIVDVFDILGQHVATLASGWHQPGTYTVTFVAPRWASGVYVYRLRAENRTVSGKMVLLR